MLSLWTALALALYLAPIAIGLIATARPGREPWRAGLGLVTIVAVDLMSVLLIARFTRLDLATVISRALWVFGGGAVIYLRRNHIRAWWREVELRRWWGPMLCACVGIWLSTVITAECGIWDRYWHIPLSASLRGQRTPFFNVYEPSGGLYYHYAGDAMAAMLQALSLAHLHSSVTLSRAHDLIMGLFGVTVALLLPAFGLKRVTWQLCCTVAMLLGGPVTLFISGELRPRLGTSVANLFSLSYRPHTPLAYLFILGMAAALLLPVVAEPRIAPRRLRPALFACTAALVLSDETSLALLGVLWAVLWLLEPSCVATTRRHGLFWGCALLGTIAGVIAIYGGSFTPGVPHPGIKFLDAFRVPGFMQASLPLTTRAGVVAFVSDFWLVLAACLAGGLAVLCTRRRVASVAFAGFAVMSVVGLLALTRLEVNGGSTESHRFATLSLFLAPLFLCYFAAFSTAHWRPATGELLVGSVAALGMSLPVMSTVEWLFGLRDLVCTFGSKNETDLDCRRFVGASNGDRAEVAYVDADHWYRVAGCRPIRAPSSQTDLAGHATPTGWPATGWPALRTLDRWRGEAPLTAYCAAQSSDVVCVALQQTGACTSTVGEFQTCQVSKPQRAKLMAKPGR